MLAGQCVPQEQAFIIGCIYPTEIRANGRSPVISRGTLLTTLAAVCLDPKCSLEESIVGRSSGRRGPCRAANGLATDTYIGYVTKSRSLDQAPPDQNRIGRKKIPTPSAKWSLRPQKPHYFPGNSPLSANSNWRAEGRWRPEKFLTYKRFCFCADANCKNWKRYSGRRNVREG